MRNRRIRAHAKRPLSPRYLNRREPLDRFLIVCEGKQTEPNYFRAFRVPTVVVQGAGRNTIQIVREAVRQADIEEYDQVWCVFDRDSFPEVRFNEALALADQSGIRVAYSNECFELWYLLHFDFCDTALGRAACCRRLSSKIAGGYLKNSESLYRLLLDLQPQAIRNAERLLAQYQPPQPARDNPSTTVHLLVKELNRFVRQAPPIV